LHHFGYRLADFPVVDLELVERRKIGRSPNGISRSLTLRLRKREIEPGCQLPGRAIELGSFGKEGMPIPARPPSLAGLPEPVAIGLLAGRRHSFP